MFDFLPFLVILRFISSSNYFNLNFFYAVEAVELLVGYVNIQKIVQNCRNKSFEKKNPPYRFESNEYKLPKIV